MGTLRVATEFNDILDGDFFTLEDDCSYTPYLKIQQIRCGRNFYNAVEVETGLVVLIPDDDIVVVTQE